MLNFTFTIPNFLKYKIKAKDYNIQTQQYFYTGCPTRYRNRHFFNNFTTNEDIETKFVGDYKHIPLHFSHNELLFKFRCNIFIGVRIITELSGSVASGTHCSILLYYNIMGYMFRPLFESSSGPQDNKVLM